MLGHNAVTLLGTISERGVELRPMETSGTLQATCRLEVREAGQNGQEFTLWMPLVAFGQAREALVSCEAGDPILVSGKLRWQSWVDKTGQKQGTLQVVALHVNRLIPAATAAGVA